MRAMAIHRLSDVVEIAIRSRAIICRLIACSEFPRRAGARAQSRCFAPLHPMRRRVSQGLPVHRDV